MSILKPISIMRRIAWKHRAERNRHRHKMLCKPKGISVIISSGAFWEAPHDQFMQPNPKVNPDDIQMIPWD